MAKRGLGKGLGALLGDISAPSDVETAGSVVELKLSQVEPNREQPRKIFDEDKLEALAASIQQHGVIQPIIVKEQANGYYQIIAGERRWRASRKAGRKTIPAIIRTYDELDSMQVALIENLQREDLNPIEEALGYKTLLETFSLTQEKVSAQVGKSRPAIANSLRLLSLPPAIQKMLEDRSLSSGHARAILSISPEDKQLLLAEKIIENGLNVRQAEALAKTMQRPQAQKKQSEENPALQHQLQEIQKRISDSLGTKVRILNGEKKGRIEIEYYGTEDLSRLLNLLKL